MNTPFAMRFSVSAPWDDSEKPETVYSSEVGGYVFAEKSPVAEDDSPAEDAKKKPLEISEEELVDVSGGLLSWGGGNVTATATAGIKFWTAQGVLYGTDADS